MVLLSVIIPAYKEQKYLRQTLESITSQSMYRPNDVEVVVVDYDPDGEFMVSDIVKEFAHLNVRRVYADTKGIGYARHMGCVYSVGQILMMFDADAQFTTHDGMERLVRPIRNKISLYTYPEWIMEEKTEKDWLADVFLSLGVVQQWMYNWVPHNHATGITVTRDAYFDMGGFADMYRSEDYDFAERFVERFGPEARQKVPDMTIKVSPRRTLAWLNGDADAFVNHKTTAYR